MAIDSDSGTWLTFDRVVRALKRGRRSLTTADLGRKKQKNKPDRKLNKNKKMRRLSKRPRLFSVRERALYGASICRALYGARCSLVSGELEASGRVQGRWHRVAASAKPTCRCLGRYRDATCNIRAVSLWRASIDSCFIAFLLFSFVYWKKKTTGKAVIGDFLYLFLNQTQR